MSKLQKWLKGQKSKKEAKLKNDKTNPKQTPVSKTPPAPLIVSPPNRNAKVPRPNLRHRILAAGLHTRTSTAAKNTAAQDVITVIPEGRKEIHISVSELRRPTSNTTETKRGSNRLRDDILASVSRHNNQGTSTPVPKFESTSRTTVASTIEIESVPSPNKAKESAPSPKVESALSTPISTSQNETPATKAETQPRSSKSPLPDEAEKPNTPPPAKVTSQVSEEAKTSKAEEQANDLPQSDPSSQDPKQDGNPNRAPAVKTSPTLTPRTVTQTRPKEVKSGSNEYNKSTTISIPTGASQRPTETTKSSSLQPTRGAPLSTLSTSTTEEKKAMNTSYHYSKTFPPPNPTGGLQNLEESVSPISSQVFERLCIPPGVLSICKNVGCDHNSSTNVLTPLNQRPAAPKPKREAYILKLSPEIILQIVSHLTYLPTAFLKLSCRTLNRNITLTHLTPSPYEKLSVVQEVRPRSDFKGDRNPPYLCKDCVIWHSFEHMIIWPHPRPENVFLNYADFKLQKPRRCVRYAVKSGEWVIGKRISGEHVLCGKCVTPSARGECAWNCGRCGKCTGRKAWSGFCEECWRVGDGEELGRKGRVETWDYATGSKLPKLSDKKSKRKICGRCLGSLDFEPGSREVCRCGESHRATY